MKSYIILLLICLLGFSCSGETDMVNDHIAQDDQEERRDEVPEENQPNEGEGEQEEEADDDDDDSPREIDGLGITDEAIDVSPFGLQLDTIPATGEISIRLSESIDQSRPQQRSASPSHARGLGDIQIGSVLMDNVNGFLVKVIEIRDNVLTVVDASLDEFFFEGITHANGLGSLNPDTPHEILKEIDFNFDFEKTFFPTQNVRVTAAGGVRYDPVINIKVNHDKKSINFSSSSGDHIGDLEITGSLELEVSGNVEEEIEITLGRAEKSFLIGPVFTTVRFSLIYSPNVAATSSFSEKQTLNLRYDPDWNFSFDEDRGFEVDLFRTGVNTGFRTEILPNFQFDANFSIGHRLIARTEILFFRKAGFFGDLDLAYQATHGSNGNDWEYTRTKSINMNLGFTQKIFKAHEHIELLDYTVANLAPFKVPRRLHWVEGFNPDLESQTVRLFVGGGGFPESSVLRLRDNIIPAPNVKIYGYLRNNAFDSDDIPITFGNGQTAMILETDTMGFVEFEINRGTKISTRTLPNGEVVTDRRPTWLGAIFEIRDLNGERITGFDSSRLR